MANDERLLRLPDVKKMTGLSHSTIWRYEKKGEFPKRIRVTLRCSAWKFSEVQAFIERCANA